jgi:methylmalonyl-CoA/ethylmalonyl-CoA epimerase
MLKVKKIDHVAVCVADVDEAGEAYRGLFGVAPGECEYLESQGVDAMLLPLGETSLELIAPRGSESVARFLAKRGPAIHHIAFEVEAIDEAVAWLRGRGVPLIDQQSRLGARGRKVAFLHPRATGGVLVELVGEALEPADHAKPRGVRRPGKFRGPRSPQ